jgi:isoquinoline 1-oxidoreductase beta subunit
MRNNHLQAGFWRGVNVNPNAVYVESFIDELAHELKQDPLAFRLKMIKPKHGAVLRKVAEMGDWGKPAPGGHYRGLAQFHGYGSYVAACAEISVENGNRITIHRISAATDPGTAVNPAQIERQTMGSFVYGLTALLYGDITLKDGAIEQKNFDTYQMMRIREMPKVDVTVMPSGGFWGGVGEPTIAVAAPAVLNAYFAATGKRIRTFPLKNHDIRTA